MVELSGTTPLVGTSPSVGLRPTSPHNAEGMRIDPPVSVPIDAYAMSVATEIAEPPDDPPGERLGSSGCLAGPNADSSFVVPNANSCRLVLPIRTAPAARRRVTTVASAAAT